MIIPYLSGSAQDKQESFSFSLQQSIDYAFKNQSNVVNATLDEEIAQEKVKEVTAAALPQISAGFDVKKYLELPTTVIPENAFNPAAPPNELLAVNFGLKNTATASVDASWVFLDASLFFSRQASKAYVELSKNSSDRTRIETAVAVSKAYYNVLVVQEQIKLADANVVRLKKLLDDTRAMNENGFAEKIDVDRILLNYNSALADQDRIHRFMEISLNTLKYQMGMHLSSDLQLTDKLQESDFTQTTVNDPAPDYTKRTEYILMQNQEKLSQLDLSNKQWSRLPSVAFYGSLATQAQRFRANYLDSDKPWYPYSLIGFKISAPIFDGTMRRHRIAQAQLSLKKAQTSLETLGQFLELDIRSATINLNNNLSALKIQKENLLLAEEVTRVAKVKYDQGVGSNLEVVTAESSLKAAQTIYYSALYDAYLAKIEYSRAYGNIKY